jgi:hypothetical protein
LETFCSLSFFFVRSEKLLFLMVEEKKKEKWMTKSSRAGAARKEPVTLFLYLG